MSQVMLHAGGFPYAPFGRAEIIDRAARLAAYASWRTDWEPGTRFEYHALSAHWVLADIITEVTGRPYVDVIAERVMEPAGCSRWLGIGVDDQADVADVVGVGSEPTPEELAALGLDELPDAGRRGSAHGLQPTLAAGRRGSRGRGDRPGHRHGPVVPGRAPQPRRLPSSGGAPGRHGRPPEASRLDRNLLPIAPTPSSWPEVTASPACAATGGGPRPEPSVTAVPRARSLGPTRPAGSRSPTSPTAWTATTSLRNAAG